MAVFSLKFLFFLFIIGSLKTVKPENIFFLMDFFFVAKST